MPITDITPLFPKLLIQGKLVVNNDIIISDVKDRFVKENRNKNSDAFFTSSPHLHKELIYDQLSDAILKFVNLSATEIFCYDEILPEISLMWATVSGPGESVHKHYHPNSLFSGVYYPQNIEYSSIRFYTPYKTMLLPRKKESNIFNSHSISFKPTQGDIFLFPSDLEHDTEENTDNENRISIAFNVFFRGKFGDDSILSSLTI